VRGSGIWIYRARPRTCCWRATGDRVSVWFWNYPARSRTFCWQAMGESESVRGSGTIRQDHVLPVGERWEGHCQCVVLQLSSKITYSLLVSDGRDRLSGWFRTYSARSRTACWRAMEETVSGWFCTYPARSRTACWRAIGETESVCGSATIL